MKEYFVVANSFAAPFFSDLSTLHIKGEDPEDAMKKFIISYKHPCGLYAATLYQNADAYHKDLKPLCTALSKLEREKQKLTKDLGGYSIRHETIGKDTDSLEIDGKLHLIENPKQVTVIKER